MPDLTGSYGLLDPGRSRSRSRSSCIPAGSLQPESDDLTQPSPTQRIHQQPGGDPLGASIAVETDAAASLATDRPAAAVVGGAPRAAPAVEEAVVSTAVLTEELVGVIKEDAAGTRGPGTTPGAPALSPIVELAAGTATVTVSGMDRGEGPTGQLEDDAGEEGDNFALHAAASSSERRREKKRHREGRGNRGVAGGSSLVVASKRTTTTVQGGAHSVRSRDDDVIVIIEPTASSVRASPIVAAGMTAEAAGVTAEAETVMSSPSQRAVAGTNAEG